ncbi:hypothetical protein GALMADRAFT_933989 [Galerina marginata CBS 339.88]|uniref:Uncharacterized protein n=1 Tax=Galerina marginata (strain CBS 339.88) TaxID=685588 RepID=A0A067SGE0_GALM3|nr:hypothetical protein GALMADRAFT_933989 [Galerina marginata CBS 339.88]
MRENEMHRERLVAEASLSFDAGPDVVWAVLVGTRSSAIVLLEGLFLREQVWGIRQRWISSYPHDHKAYPNFQHARERELEEDMAMLPSPCRPRHHCPERQRRRPTHPSSPPRRSTAFVTSRSTMGSGVSRRRRSAKLTRASPEAANGAETA